MDLKVFWAWLINQIEDSSINLNNKWWPFVVIIITILTAAIVIYFYLKKRQKTSSNLGVHDDRIILESPFKSKCQDLRPTANNNAMEPAITEDDIDYDEFVTNDSGVYMSPHNSPILDSAAIDSSRKSLSNLLSFSSSKNSSSAFEADTTPPPPPHIKKRWQKLISEGKFLCLFMYINLIYDHFVFFN